MLQRGVRVAEAALRGRERKGGSRTKNRETTTSGTAAIVPREKGQKGTMLLRIQSQPVRPS